MGPSGRRSSPPVAPAGSLDGLIGSVVAASEWSRDALRALALVIVVVVPARLLVPATCPLALSAQRSSRSG